MRSRQIKKQIWFNEEEDRALKRKIKLTGMSEAALIRCLVMDFEPKEKPNEEFYKSMNSLYAMSNNLNQLTKKANTIGFIDMHQFKSLADQINNVILEIKERFLIPDKK